MSLHPIFIPRDPQRLFDTAASEPAPLETSSTLCGGSELHPTHRYQPVFFHAPYSSTDIARLVNIEHDFRHILEFPLLRISLACFISSRLPLSPRCSFHTHCLLPLCWFNRAHRASSTHSDPAANPTGWPDRVQSASFSSSLFCMGVFGSPLVPSIYQPVYFSSVVLRWY